MTWGWLEALHNQAALSDAANRHRVEAYNYLSSTYVRREAEGGLVIEGTAQRVTKATNELPVDEPPEAA